MEQRRGLVAELFEHNLGHALRHTQLPATRLLCALSHESADATAELGSLLSARLDLCLAHYPQLPTDSLLQTEVALLCELCALEDDLWCDRLRLLVGLFFRGLKHLHSAFICERVVLPCLKTIVRLSTPPNKPPAPAANGSVPAQSSSRGAPARARAIRSTEA